MNVSFDSLCRLAVVYSGLLWMTCLCDNVLGLTIRPTHHDTTFSWKLSIWSRNGDGFDNNNNNDDDYRLSQIRRHLLSFMAFASSSSSSSAAAAIVASPAKSDSTSDMSHVPQSTSRVTVPLEYTGQELLIYYRVDGSLFRAVVDTGSPFLLIPGSCGENTRSKAGCYREQGVSSGLPDTFEQFDGFEGNVEWRMAPVTLVNATGSLMTQRPLIIFGVASESILGGPGGVFFGLIRDTDNWIRPSLLGQTTVSSFQLDLRSPLHKMLTLSKDSMITSDEDPIRLTSDLRRKYGDPVSHYTARAQSILVNGVPLAEQGLDKPPIYVIFDTGVTGMVVSRELFNERYTTARQRKEKNLWGTVDISFRTLSGKTVVISAKKPLTTPFDPQQNWSKFRRGHLIVLGLSFLDGHRITIDIDGKSLLLE